ncbi:uncharacterized protein EKO05_0009291 [Ascochyta rabiei]|uniref:Uncharacterized protein n=1 Tax=Didymella rabiei TaxID=5454 RepID=A0A163ETA4_DIDRA|nr:uncharacterized protein EKO05_0009291 [Ascochyta rabiei]KZM23905.1 hypothetical protein ST47_g4870 [Ascochyta rabiei]UPX19014.1 hypothetical protein EKO05_0009291 [Ascochyta rabiei]
MGFFHLHRTSSSSSSRSVSSAVFSASNYSTPRTSSDLADDYMSATLKPCIAAPRAPLLDLPFEILQHIASYLDNVSAARFSLSGRQVCYAVGTKSLSAYVGSSPSPLDARERLENTIERALPGAWHCAWCDKFHQWSVADGPTSAPHAPQTPCTDYNSYLSDGMGYTLRYHHIRLALAHYNHGPSHGLPLSAFKHSTHSSITLFRTPIQTAISHEAKIKNSSFLLHTTYSLLLPTWTTSHKNLIGHLWPQLPALLTQHRASEYGHTGLMAALDNVVRRGWRVLGAHSCRDCATDWSVSAHAIPRSAAGEFTRLTIQTWRMLGGGSSPFEVQWRAHGLYIPGSEESCAREEASMAPGGVREAFEGPSCGDAVSAGEGGRDAWDTLAHSWQVDKHRAEQRDQEAEWRAIWTYIERRAGAPPC